MLARILRVSIEHRVLVVVLALGAALAGVQALRRLPIDAVPDITNNQVQVNTLVPSLSPVEIEMQVTVPLETALAGIPGLEYTRSLSRNGFSQVTAVFADDVDVYFARQQVGERLLDVRERMPAGAEPRMGPITTGLGEVFMWTVEFEHPPRPAVPGAPGWQIDGTYLTPEGERLTNALERAAYLRTIQDWVVRPQLRTVPGVAGVDVIGGYVKEYQVQPDPQRLVAHGIGFHDVVEALERNNVSTGAGYVEHNGDAWLVRAAGRLESPEQIAAIAVGERFGLPVYVSDVAWVGVGREMRMGSASKDGEEVVVGTAFMLIGANSRTVAAAVGARLTEVNRSLPPGVRAQPVLDRTALVDATIHTVATNLVEGAVLVIVVLFVLLGHLRAALVTALAIPLSMLLTAVGMVQTHTSGNLMSLGAIDFGLVVDGAVIIVENCLRVLAERQRSAGRPLERGERLRAVFDGSMQVRSATAFGEAIIVFVYLPVLFLTGVEGKMFRPMALTVIFALAAAFVLSLTFVPAMVALCVTGRVEERENPLVRLAKRGYAPVLTLTMRWRWSTVAAAVAAFGGALLLGQRLGQEFAPQLQELDLLVQAVRVPSTGITQATAMQLVLEREIGRLPEVALVFSKTGTAEMAADPMPPNVSDTFVILRPRAEWPDPHETKEHVRERVEAVASRLPGQAYEFTQPIQMRFNELLAGVRGDVAVKVFGDDFGALVPVAERIARVLRATPGSADVRVEQVTQLPTLGIDVDRATVARYGLTVADVQEVLAIAVGGQEAGELFQGDRRFPLVVRLPEPFRESLDALERLPVPVGAHEEERALAVATAGDRPGFHFLPLGTLARITLAEGASQIGRENGKRRIVVQANVRGRDLGSFVADVQARIERGVSLPPGTWLGWGGQFEKLVEAKRRLGVVVPACFAAIFALLYWTFGSARHALLVFSGVPLGLTGGIVALWLRGMPFSISAAVGFIALSGVAVLNGLVLVSFVNDLRTRGKPLDEAVLEGALTRLRPVLVTALVASLGFVPMALATGTGAEVQRPLATVVIGGLLTSTALTLLVLPALYSLFGERGASQAG